MKISRHILAEAIARRTLHVSDEKLLAREIAAYLLLEQRTAELESILRDIMQFRIERGVLEAEVVAAHEVQDRVLGEVKSLLKSTYSDAKTVHLQTRIDPNVVGGLRIDMPNQQLDLTVRSKLATFKRLTSQKGI